MLAKWASMKVRPSRIPMDLARLLAPPFTGLGRIKEKDSNDCNYV